MYNAADDDGVVSTMMVKSQDFPPEEPISDAISTPKIFHQAIAVDMMRIIMMKTFAKEPFVVAMVAVIVFLPPSSRKV